MLWIMHEPAAKREAQACEQPFEAAGIQFHNLQGVLDASFYRYVNVGLSTHYGAAVICSVLAHSGSKTNVTEFCYVARHCWQCCSCSRCQPPTQRTRRALARPICSSSSTRSLSFGLLPVRAIWAARHETWRRLSAQTIQRCSTQLSGMPGTDCLAFFLQRARRCRG